MLKKHWKLVGIMAVVVGGLALCIGTVANKQTTEAVANKQTAEQEQAVSIEQVPTAVKATIEAQGGTIEEIEMETENGQTFYEAEVIVDGQEVELKVAADGTLLSKEVEDEDDDEAVDDDDEDEDDDDDDEDDEDEDDEEDD